MYKAHEGNVTTEVGPSIDNLREQVASIENEDALEYHEMEMLWKRYGPGVESLYLVATILFYCLLTCLWVHFRQNIEVLCERI